MEKRITKGNQFSQGRSYHINASMWKEIDFKEGCILLDGERIEKDWKPTWRAIKAR